MRHHRVPIVVMYTFGLALATQVVAQDFEYKVFRQSRSNGQWVGQAEDSTHASLKAAVLRVLSVNRQLGVRGGIHKVEKSRGDDLVGTWAFSRRNGRNVEYYQYEFRSDGTGYKDIEGHSPTRITWSQDGNEVLVIELAQRDNATPVGQRRAILDGDTLRFVNAGIAIEYRRIE